jgi:hypothetical protein
MDFKQFINEMPHILGRDIQVKCPMGDIIDINDLSYAFDFAVEFCGDEKVKAFMLDKMGMRVKDFKGRLPFFCMKHDILFMYDFDNDSYIPNVTPEEKQLLLTIQKGMRKHPDHKERKINIHIDS